MADERATKPTGSNGHFDGAIDTSDKVIEGGKERPRGTEPTRRRNILSSRARPLAARVSWQGLALAAVLVLSAFLNLYGLPSEGYANSYYAATVKNMLTSWHNFFFVSYDAGFVSVDKPPLGLWVQATSAWLFGFNGLSLLLPQASAGVLSVALIYYLVRRTFGPVAGLLAALALAVTPISVAVQRNNLMDALLILALLLAAWAFMAAAERGSLRWLLLGVVVVGLGFNIKMLQALLVLPAFYLLYLLAVRATWRRLLHLGAATIVLLAVSLSWAVAVDLTLPTERPYVGSSPDDSVLSLVVGYNGFDRLSGASFGSGGELIPAGAPGGPGTGTRELGDPGPLRLLNGQLAGQASWLLPLAVMGLLAASWQRGRPRLPLDPRHAALVLWGTWFLTVAAYLSVAEGGHRYYTVMLAPAVAALVGIGVTALWRDYRRSGWRGWLLPLALVSVAALQAYILASYPDWGRWLAPAILGLGLGAAGFLVVARLRGRGLGEQFPYPAVAASVGVMVLLIAPTSWAAYTAWQGTSGELPSAGPRPSQAFGPPGPPGGPPGKGPPGGGPPKGGGSPGGGPLGGGPGSRNANPELVEYLQANKGDAGYLVAASSAMSASPIILNTDEPVISFGGYNGIDPVFTADDLADLVDEGAVRFFLMPDREAMEEMRAEREAAGDEPPPLGGPSPGGPQGGFGPGGGLPQNGSAEWIEDHCEKVPQELWQPPEDEGRGRGGPPGRMRALYDCGAGGS